MSLQSLTSRRAGPFVRGRKPHSRVICADDGLSYLAPHRLRMDAACERASGATAPEASPAGLRADPFVLGRIPSSVRKPYLNGLVAALQGLRADSVYVRASGATARLDGRQMPISVRRLPLPNAFPTAPIDAIAPRASTWPSTRVLQWKVVGASVVTQHQHQMSTKRTFFRR